MPKESEYYLGNEYWKKAEENIGEKATPVTQEVRKLLGKEDKGIDATNYAEEIQNKKVNEIKTFLDDEYWKDMGVLKFSESKAVFNDFEDPFNLRG